MVPLAIAVVLLAQHPVSRDIAAFRAYSEPSANLIEIPDSGPVKGWKDKKGQLVWYVKFRRPGVVNIALQVNASSLVIPSIRLKSMDSRGTLGFLKSKKGITGLKDLNFGAIRIRQPGYVRFEISSESPLDGLEIRALRLSGVPVEDALINETRWRSSASVHLRWPTPKDAPVTWFYNEILPKTSPLATYYMACGWSRGYFGIQVNSPVERRVIFSVWDSGNEKVSREKVDKDLQVQLVGKGEGVFTGSFGNEGTGGHSHLVYPWKTGKVQRFLVRAQPQGEKTTYSGYYYFNESKKWGLISSWSAPQDGKYLRSLYSFIEDFWGGEGQRQRLADFGPAWVRTGSDWTQVVEGSFTHTARMPNYREDYYFNVNGSRVTASAGGYTNDGPTAYGAKFNGVLLSGGVRRDVLEFVAKVDTQSGLQLRIKPRDGK